jgi:hypothetical protein
MLISVIIPIHNRLDLAISAIGKRKDLRRDLVGHEDRSRSEDRAVIPGCGSMTWPFYSAPIEFDEAVKRGLRLLPTQRRVRFIRLRRQPAGWKGMRWQSPRGMMSIDPETRDVVQTDCGLGPTCYSRSVGLPFPNNRVTFCVQISDCMRSNQWRPACRQSFSGSGCTHCASPIRVGTSSANPSDVLKEAGIGERR